MLLIYCCQKYQEMSSEEMIHRQLPAYQIFLLFGLVNRNVRLDSHESIVLNGYIVIITLINVFNYFSIFPCLCRNCYQSDPIEN